MRISWTVDGPSTSQVEYGPTTAYGRTTAPQVSFGCLSHVQDLRGLYPGTTYHFRITATDHAGGASTSQDVLLSTDLEPSPLPVASNGVEYAAAFAGDPSGATDVTDALRAFLDSNAGASVALAPDAVYAVTQLAFTAHDLTVDFRGALIQGTEPGVSGILRIQSSSNIHLNDPTVYGTGYSWIPPIRTSMASTWTACQISSSITRPRETREAMGSTPAIRPARTTRQRVS